MKIYIDTTLKVLENKFLSQGYPIEVAASMSKSLITSELFGKKTHGLTRYNWILKNKIPKENSYTTLEISDSIGIVDCSDKNGYYIAQKEVENMCDQLMKEHTYQTRILKNVFPTNALIEYLEKFHSNNIGAIIITTTPKLVGLRGSGKRIVGTNPIGYTFSNSHSVILADLSTSNIPLGKIIEKSQEIQEKIVLDCDGVLSVPQKVINKKGEFIGSLLPFGGAEGEHKGLSISLLIEFISSALAGTRSKMGDMIIFAFSQNHPIYKSEGVDDLISSLLETQSNFRFPGGKSYMIHNQNIKSGYVDVDDKVIHSLSLSSDELNKIKHEK